jgi:hypothetical protein
MKLVTTNKNEFIVALKKLIKEYQEEYTGTITVDIQRVKIEKSKLTDWKQYCKNAYRQGEADYCTEWDKNFKQDNPLAIALMYYIGGTDRNTSVDMIEELEDTLLNSMPKEYSLKENWSDTFEGVVSILKNPAEYPNNLVKDLDSVIEQFYKYHPLFRWDW